MLQTLKDNFLQILESLTPNNNERVLNIALTDQQRRIEVQHIKDNMKQKTTRTKQQQNPDVREPEEEVETDHEVEQQIEPEEQVQFQISDHVAVAYENRWYPGIILDAEDETCKMFATCCRGCI